MELTTLCYVHKEPDELEERTIDTKIIKAQEFTTGRKSN